MIRQPFRALVDKAQHDGMQHGKHTPNAQNNAPHTAIAQKETQQLRQEDAKIDTRLRKTAKKAFVFGNRNLADNQRSDDRRRADADSANKAAGCHDPDCGGEGFEDWADDEEDGVVEKCGATTILGGDCAGDQCADETANGQDGVDDADLEGGHVEALWELVVGVGVAVWGGAGDDGLRCVELGLRQVLMEWIEGDGRIRVKRRGRRTR